MLFDSGDEIYLSNYLYRCSSVILRPNRNPERIVREIYCLVVAQAFALSACGVSSVAANFQILDVCSIPFIVTGLRRNAASVPFLCSRSLIYLE